MKIKTKLMLSYLIFVAMLLGLGIFAGITVLNVNENGENIYQNRLMPVIDLTKIVESTGEMRLEIVQALQKKDRSISVTNKLNEVDLIIKKYSNANLIKEEEVALNQFIANWEIYKKRAKISEAFIQSGEFEQANESILLGQDEYRAAKANLHELLSINEKQSKKLIDENDTSFKNIRTRLFISIAAGIIIAITIATITGNKIANTIKLVVNRVEKIALGDLMGERITVKSKDELKQLADGVNSMQSSLHSLVMSTSKTSEQLSAAAEELGASAEQSTLATEQIAVLSQNSTLGAEKQLHSINEVGHSIKNLSTSIQQIAINSNDMLNISEKANESTINGSKIVHNVVLQMNVISKIVGDLSTLIQNLDEKSKEIGNITSMITDISEQTNLLALNAAIEAARAGEQGKGFAVVADEVRKLAEQSKKSAAQITNMLNEIQNETNNAVIYMNSGTEKVNEGIGLSVEVNDSFNDIQQLITSVTSKVQEVSASIQEMASVGDHIVTSSEHVKNIAEASVLASQESSAATEEQLATMEEISSSAHALTSLAEELQNMIARFKV